VLDLDTTPGDLVVRGATATGLGSTVAVGRWTRDGTMNLVLGAPGEDGQAGARPDAGAVHVLAGVETLRGIVDLGTATPDATIHGVDPGDAFGSGWRGSGLVVGDVSGDGLDDVAAHAPGGQGAGNATGGGETHVVFGEPRGGAHLWTAVTDPASLAFSQAGIASPWDGPAGLLDDGALHFFRLEEAAGERFTVAVTPQERDRTVRISWAAGSPPTILPDPVASDLAVSSGCVRPDGTSTAVLRVVPRDAFRDRLGIGLDVRPSIPAAWLPGVATGGFRDLGDGRYELEVAAGTEGLGLLAVDVEGVVLDGAPSVTFSTAAAAVTPVVVPSPATVATDVSFTADVSGGVAPFSHAWDFDGNGLVDSTEAMPVHRYASAGWRTIAVTVTDGAGCTARGTTQIFVE
jgi:hypothetical protein